MVNYPKCDADNNAKYEVSEGADEPNAKACGKSGVKKPERKKHGEFTRGVDSERLLG